MDIELKQDSKSTKIAVFCDRGEVKLTSHNLPTYNDVTVVVQEGQIGEDNEKRVTLFMTLTQAQSLLKALKVSIKSAKEKEKTKDSISHPITGKAFAV